MQLRSARGTEPGRKQSQCGAVQRPGRVAASPVLPHRAGAARSCGARHSNGALKRPQQRGVLTCRAAQQEQVQQQGEDDQQSMFALPRVFSALMPGGAVKNNPILNAALPTASAVGPVLSSSTPSPGIPTPPPTARPSPAAAATSAAAIGRHPLLGARLLNLGPNASPSALAAALTGNGREGGAPSWVPQATATATVAEVEVDAPPAPPSPDDVQGLAPDTGAGEEEGGMVSVAQVQAMLSGLRESLKSIQASRGQYARLLADRDTWMGELRAQLREKDQRIRDLEQNLKLARELAVEASEEAEVAAALAQAAAEQVQLQAAQIAEATAAAQAAQEVALAAVAQQQQLLLQRQQAEAEAQLQQRLKEAEADASPPRATPPPQAQTQEVVLHYKTPWRQVNVHYSADGKAWTSNPGVPMDSSKDGNTKVLRVPCSRIEFVFNNGKGEWDSPPGNYKINSPGFYRVEHGNIRKL